MKKILTIILLSIAFLITTLTYVFAESELISEVELYPESLTISRFSPYNLLANILNSPSFVSVEIFGTTSGTEVDWNFYVDGSVYSESITKTMSYDEVLGKYKSTNIYPDNIYIQKYFSLHLQ